MKNSIIYAIGNALLDYEYRVSEDFLNEINLTKGCMELNDRENHIRIHSEIKNKFKDIKVMPGGSVANSIYTLAQLNLNVAFSGKVTDDKSGNIFIKSLEKIGVNTKIIKSNMYETGECLVLITDDNERTMYTYLGSSADLRHEDISTEMIKNSKYVLVEGYLVSSTTTTDVAKHAFEKASALKTKKILTLSDPNIVKFFHENIIMLMDQHLDMVFCNENEAYNISKTDNLSDAVNFLKKYSNEIIITLGEKGSLFSDTHGTVNVEAIKANPVDLTGAGDMFLASFIYSREKDNNVLNALKFANHCSGKIIEQYGAKLSHKQDYLDLLTI
ncbi:MAG: hypothetical protein CMD88_01505 [Gammaproteobacteria bacterium]|nr:hypothetical protein [Gammaproteobacteria bacterium]|tara:strand:- start:215704 stop:216693 length:990 start_codon:yes stop_codon:yes gene_type:complete